MESCSGPFGLPADDAAGAGPVIGADATVPESWSGLRPDAVLFGESQSRILVSLAPEAWDALAALAGEHGVPLHRLGRTGGERVRIAPLLDVPLAAALETHATALERLAALAAPGHAPPGSPPVAPATPRRRSARLGAVDERLPAGRGERHGGLPQVGQAAAAEHRRRSRPGARRK